MNPNPRGESPLRLAVLLIDALPPDQQAALRTLHTSNPQVLEIRFARAHSAVPASWLYYIHAESGRSDQVDHVKQWVSTFNSSAVFLDVKPDFNADDIVQAVGVCIDKKQAELNSGQIAQDKLLEHFKERDRVEGLFYCNKTIDAVEVTTAGYQQVSDVAGAVFVVTVVDFDEVKPNINQPVVKTDLDDGNRFRLRVITNCANHISDPVYQNYYDQANKQRYRFVSHDDIDHAVLSLLDQNTVFPIDTSTVVVSAPTSIHSRGSALADKLLISIGAASSIVNTSTSSMADRLQESINKFAEVTRLDAVVTRRINPDETLLYGRHIGVFINDAPDAKTSDYIRQRSSWLQQQRLKGTAKLEIHLCLSKPKIEAVKPLEAPNCVFIQVESGFDQIDDWAHKVLEIAADWLSSIDCNHIVEHEQAILQ